MCVCLCNIYLLAEVITKQENKNNEYILDVWTCCMSQYYHFILSFFIPIASIYLFFSLSRSRWPIPHCACLQNIVIFLALIIIIIIKWARFWVKWLAKWHVFLLSCSKHAANMTLIASVCESFLCARCYWNELSSCIALSALPFWNSCWFIKKFKSISRFCYSIRCFPSAANLINVCSVCFAMQIMPFLRFDR